MFWAVESVKDSRKTPLSTYEDEDSKKVTEVNVLASKLLTERLYVFNAPRGSSQPALTNKLRRKLTKQ